MPKLRVNKIAGQYRKAGALTLQVRFALVFNISRIFTLTYIK